MWNNYLKIALRHLRRNKIYALLNIAGLAIGMMACILILLWVKDELSFDRYHEKSDQIYRISREWFNDSGESSLHLGHLAPPFAPHLKSDFEGIIQEVVRVTSHQPLISYGDKKIVEEGFFFADSAVFDIFSWRLVAGNPASALAQPQSVVLTRSAARKYFGEEDPMGKMLNIDNERDLQVTGIAEDPPGNSHFVWTMLGSFDLVEDWYGGKENMMGAWGSNNFSTYVLLPPGYAPADLEAQFPAFLDKHMGEWRGKPNSNYNQLHLMKLTDIHLHSQLDSEIGHNGNVAYVKLFTIVAALILLIACINFINLSTAQSSRRAREVGLRKVIGALRISLISQFLVESLVMATLALILAVGLVFLGLPTFNEFFGKDLVLDLAGDGSYWLMLIGIVLISGVVAGSYPALYLSSFEPIAILRSDKRVGGKRSGLWAGLVVLQFSISILLIIGVGVIRDQLDYVRSKSLGFHQEDLVVLGTDDDFYDQWESVRNDLQQHPGIIMSTFSSRVPSGRLLDSQGGSAEVDGEMKALTERVADIHVDHDYMRCYEIEFAAGRDFNRNLASDSAHGFILNESAVAAIGWENAEDAVGKKFHYGGREGQVIGVVKDFHFESLHQSIAPMVFMVTQGRARMVTVRMYAAAREDVMAWLEEKWNYLEPGYPMDYFFVEDRFSEQYEEEDRTASLITGFSILAVIIACLGLFGLASFTAEQRSREIGIRKVMGASVGNIVFLLTTRFTLLVAIAFALAAVGAIWVHPYLVEPFAYRSKLSWGLVALAGIGAILIAWLTIGYQSWRAATINPVEAIRHE